MSKKNRDKSKLFVRIMAGVLAGLMLLATCRNTNLLSSSITKK